MHKRRLEGAHGQGGMAIFLVEHFAAHSECLEKLEQEIENQRKKNYGMSKSGWWGKQTKKELNANVEILYTRDREAMEKNKVS